MARILDFKCKQCRREGRKLFLKGARCFSPKCPIDRKGAVVPGMHSKKRTRKLSEFGLQLREKQKAKRIYGVNERQMRNYFTTAKRKTIRTKDSPQQKGGTGDYLLSLLETRLDNVVFRAGFVPSRSVARQVVTHGFVLVNGRRVDVPSYQLRPNDVATLSGKGMSIPIVKQTLEKKIANPKWLAKKAVAVKVLRLPARNEIDADITEQLIVEFYSR
jgi:small subunit ribosomal protein S4